MIRRIRVLVVILVGVVFANRSSKSLLTPMLEQLLAQAEVRESPIREEWIRAERRRMVHRLVWRHFENPTPRS